MCHPLGPCFLKALNRCFCMLHILDTQLRTPSLASHDMETTPFVMCPILLPSGPLLFTILL